MLLHLHQTLSTRHCHQHYDDVVLLLVVFSAVMTSCRASLARVDIHEFDLYTRPVTAILQTDNGHDWGYWMREEFCPRATYATGMELKVEPAQFARSDDTGLNGVSLECTHPYSSADHGLVRSDAAPWGAWDNMLHCKLAQHKQLFITAFQMRVERARGPLIDDTSVNSVRFYCSDTLLREMPSSVQGVDGEKTDRLESRGAPWGDWGRWSEECPVGSAVCGLQTRLTSPEGYRDDTALNDLRIFCCNDLPPRQNCPDNL